MLIYLEVVEAITFVQIHLKFSGINQPKYFFVLFVLFVLWNKGEYNSNNKSC